MLRCKNLPVRSATNGQGTLPLQARLIIRVQSRILEDFRRQLHRLRMTASDRAEDAGEAIPSGHSGAEPAVEI